MGLRSAFYLMHVHVLVALPVGDVGGEARELIAHLGLPWDPRCEAFHDNRSPSMTGSATQVRRPVYATSIGRWKEVARELEPLRRVLAERGVLPA